jgi:hypothetical protein
MNDRPVPARICGIEKEQYIRSASIYIGGAEAGAELAMDSQDGTLVDGSCWRSKNTVDHLEKE